MRIATILVLFACNTTSTTLTQKIVTLGYPETPSVVIVTRGTAESVAPWVASLRANSSATIVTELNNGPSGDTSKVCDAVRAAAPEQHVDEILVLDTEVSSGAVEPCIEQQCTTRTFLPKNDNPPTCICVRSQYEKVSSTVSASLVAVRASSCQVVASYELPPAKADSPPRTPIEFSTRNPRGEDVLAARSADETESQRLAVAALERIAPTHRWHLFPRSRPTVRSVDRHTFEVTDPDKRISRDHPYLVKTGAGPLRPSARVARVDGTTTTLETTGETTLEPRDELHITTDVRRIMVYGGVSGGTLEAQGESRGTAAAALAGRVTFERLPIMFEVRLDGDLIPGLEAARWGFGGGGGFRYQLGPIAPVAFAELGFAMAYQGNDGARAYGLLSGVGAGVELSIGKWSILADIRRRWFKMEAWEDKEGMRLDVRFPDLTWISTTIHLGIGNRF